jgi:hypothetical protein
LLQIETFILIPSFWIRNQQFIVLHLLDCAVWQTSNHITAASAVLLTVRIRPRHSSSDQSLASHQV